MINEKYETDGGSEQYLFDLCSGLEKRGHEVVIIYNDKEQNYTEDRKTYFVSSLEVGKVTEIVREIKPDIINLQNVFENALYEELPKIAPTVRYIHDNRTYSPGSSSMHFRSNSICEHPISWLHHPLYAFLEKCMSRNPIKILKIISKRKKLLSLQNNLEKILVNSSYVKKRLIQNGVIEDLIEVLPPFINIPKTSSLKLNTHKPVVLFIGRLFVEKGVEYAIKAMKEVDGELWVLGVGWDSERLKKLTQDLNLSTRVRFFGWVNKDQLSSYIEACSVLVFPSIWPEPFGLSGVAAMSFGKPVVAFDVGGVKDWLKDTETGFLVKRKDERELSKKINLLIKDKKLSKKMGEKGRNLVESKFSMARHLDRLEEIYLQAKKRNNASKQVLKVGRNL